MSAIKKNFLRILVRSFTSFYIFVKIEKRQKIGLLGLPLRLRFGVPKLAKRIQLVSGGTTVPLRLI